MGVNTASDCARNVLFAVNIIDGVVAAVLVIFGLVVVFNWAPGSFSLADFWYLWLPNFVIGGLLGIMVFLSVFGVWAKRACECCCSGCFLGLSSCLSIITMLLELTFAILTLVATDKVLAAACKNISGVWDKDAKKCVLDKPSSAEFGFDDGSGSGGGEHHDPRKMTEQVLEDYEKWAPIIAYTLFGLSFIHLCRFLMGLLVDKDKSELDEELWGSHRVSSRDSVENMRARNKFMRSQEAAMRDGTPMTGVNESGEVNIKEQSSCVIS